jgi:hypothetical protein
MTSVAKEMLDRARGLIDTSELDFSASLRALLRDLYGWPYKISAGAIRDNERVSDPFGVVIYVPPDEATTASDDAIPSDNAAAVIETVETLDVDTFETAYRRIACAKALAKSPALEVNGTPVSNTTLGGIVAQHATVPLDTIADALERLNTETHHDQWTDIVAVLGVGVINLGLQFPGEGVSGDFLPPGRAVRKANLPPCYVIITIRPVAEFAFNKFASFLTGQLGFFSPGAKLPNFNALVQGMSNMGITRGGFQYNLAGDLVPVPRERYNDRYLAPQPLRIETRKGEQLGLIQRLPWQDGSVLLLSGRKVPLEGLLLFFPHSGKPQLTVYPRPDEIQLSTILPLSDAQFLEGLRRFQRQSNMVVKPPAGQWVVQKIADEGTTSPFVARILLGVLRLRDVVYTDTQEREKFDKLFEQMTSALSSAREAARDIGTLWQNHADKVSSGAIVRRKGNVLHIEESIDRDLRRLTETFLNASIRALKHGLQQVGENLGVKLAFWFQKDPAFENGLKALRTDDAVLADYIGTARSSWSEALVLQRNAIEHDGWTLPRVTHRDTDGCVTANEPIIGDIPVRKFTADMLDRLCCAIEDIVVHLLRRRFPDVIGLHEVALGSRLPEAPERFRVTGRVGGEQLWTLAYPTTPFEQH